MTQRLIIAGGGLSGVLTAVALAERRPDIDLTVLEAGPQLGGNHTWSFYATDVRGEARDLVAPFVNHAWDGYECTFQDFGRQFSTGYRSVTSDHFHQVAMGRLGDRVRLGVKAARIDEAGVTLESGERLEADAVLDATGPRELDGVVLRWQKFLGQEVRLTGPHGLTKPTIMDARVDQHDGYRFVYLLPFTEDTLMIEDTYYAEGAAIEAEQLRGRIADYARSRGWTIAELIREEQGALPLLLSSDFDAMWASAAPAHGAVPLGLRAGLFHPVTGYSLPMSARTALEIASMTGPISTPAIRARVEKFARRHMSRSGFDRLLNRLLFLAGEPDTRHRVLARFHKLPQSLIEQFYAGRLHPAYQLRILVGKPPVPFFQAVRVVPESAALQAR